MSWLTPEWVQAVAVAIAGISAWRGFGAWRNELVGRRRYEIAEKTLTLFYEAAGVIRDMRMQSVVEETILLGYVARAVNDTQTPGEEAIKSRQDKRETILSNLLASRFCFMATFGVKYEKSFQTFERVGTQVRFEAMELASLLKQPGPHDRGTIAEINDLKQTFRLKKPDDAIESKLREAVEQVEEICRKELKGRKTFWDWW